MPFTQSQIQDIKQVVKDSIGELLNEKFISSVADNVVKKIKIDELNKNIGHIQKNISQQDTEVKHLQEQNKQLIEKLDSVEQYTRNRNIRVYGLQEHDRENIEEKICDMLTSKLGLNITPDMIEHTYRIGKKSPDAIRPVMAKFDSIGSKNIVIKNRKKLKNTGIVVAEDLTRKRHLILKEAVERLGGRNVWTLDGTVHVRFKDKRYTLRSHDDLNKLN